MQSKENEYLDTNSYKFYYYIKGVSNYPIYIYSDYGKRDINVIFNYPEIPDDVKEVTIEIYCDITPIGGNTYTLFRQLKLYRTQELTANLNYTTILQTLSLNSDMSDAMLLDAQKSISELETDLPYNINTTFIKPKVIYSSNGTLAIGQTTCDGSTLCNNRGGCFISNSFAFCKCKTGFTGKYCQISETNFKTWEIYSNNISKIADYNFYNFTGKNNIEQISDLAFKRVGLEFESSLLMYDDVSYFDRFEKFIGYILNNSNQAVVINKINENKETFVNIVNKMISLLAQTNSKNAYNNLDEKIKNSNGFIDINNPVYSIKFLNTSEYKANNLAYEFIPDAVSLLDNSTNHYNNTLRLLIQNNVQNSRIYEIPISAGVKNSKRLIQANDTTTATTTPLSPLKEVNSSYLNQTPYIILVNDPKALSLTQQQIDEFKTRYSNLKSLLKQINQLILQANLNNPIKLSQTNDIFNLTLDHFTKADFDKVDFKTYFSDRVLSNLTYVDPKQCIIENLSSIPNNTFYISFIFYDIPLFFNDYSLLNNSLSLSHSVELYDLNGNLLNITCKQSEIEHFISIYPGQTDFLRRFYMYPDKYQSNLAVYSSKYYMPYFIFANGCMDLMNPLSTQLDLYYRQYAINITKYSDEFFYINDSSDPIKNSTAYFKSIQGLNYIIASSTTTGEFAVFTYFDPLLGPLKNNYYLDYNEIFHCGENYRTNMCFITVLCLLGFNLVSLILLIALKSCFRKHSSSRAWIKQDQQALKKDNLIFNENRYSFINFENANFESQILYSKNKLFEDDNNKLSDEGNKNILIFENQLKRNNNKINNNNNGKKENEGENNFNRKDPEILSIVPKPDGERENINESEMENKNNESENLENNNPLSSGYAQIKIKDRKNKNGNLNPGLVVNNNHNKDDVENNIQELERAKNKKITFKEDKDGTTLLYKAYSNKNRLYSFFYFLIFRNIYSSFLLLSSPFSPKYKTYSKLVFLIYLNLLGVLLLFIFGPFDFYKIVSFFLHKFFSIIFYLYVSIFLLLSNYYFIIKSVLFIYQ